VKLSPFVASHFYDVVSEMALLQHYNLTVPPHQTEWSSNAQGLIQCEAYTCPPSQIGTFQTSRSRQTLRCEQGVLIS